MTHTQSVHKRKVFYLPGYDPMPARHYREMYRREGARQAGISGYNLRVQAGKGAGYSWLVEAEIDGETSRSEIEFLPWNDIVQSSMQAGIAASYWLLLRTLWLYLRTGALWALIRLRPAPMLAALYPVGALLGQLVLALLLAGLVGWLVRLSVAGWATPVDILLGATVFVAVLQRFKAADHRFYAYYLLYDYAFSAWHAGAYPAPLQARLADFKARIATALTENNDEVLIVGHSSGAHLAVEILAEMERDGMITGDVPLALLSLGHVVPMVSYLPAAKGLRRNLHDLGQSKRVFWVDVTAPGDGACFALCDPVAASGGGAGPKVLSAAFSQTLLPETYAKQKRAFFKQHFQYLHAFDRPGIYDYFAITAGPKTLESRFAAQPDSPSKRTKCTSRYTDMADG
jgi:hypothetical protein